MSAGLLEVEQVGASAVDDLVGREGPSDVPRAVAAAALIAAQYPGGVPADPTDGPSTPMPRFPAYLRDLAIKAQDCMLTTPIWLVEAWDQNPKGHERRRIIVDLRNVLDPPQREALFDL